MWVKGRPYSMGFDRKKGWRQASPNCEASDFGTTAQKNGNCAIFDRIVPSLDQKHKKIPSPGFTRQGILNIFGGDVSLFLHVPLFFKAFRSSAGNHRLDTGLDASCCKGMPEAVLSETLESCPFTYSIKDTAHSLC